MPFDWLLKRGGGKKAWAVRSLIALTFSAASIFLGIFFACIFLAATSSAVSIYQVAGTPKFLFPVITFTFLVQVIGNEYWLRRIFRFLQNREDGRETAPEQIPVVIRDALVFPLRGSLLAFILWIFSATVFPLLEVSYLHLTYFQALIIGATVLCTGMATFLLNFYLFKIILSRVLEEEIPVGTRPARGWGKIYFPIRLKLIFSFLILLVVGLSLLALLVSTYTIRTLKGQTARFGLARLQEISAEWKSTFPPDSGEAGMTAPERRKWLQARTKQIGSQVIYLDLVRKEVLGGGETKEYPQLVMAVNPGRQEKQSPYFSFVRQMDFLNLFGRIQKVLERREEGIIYDYGPGDLMLYQPIAEGQYLLARYPLSTFHKEMTWIFKFIMIIFCLGLVLSLGIARLSAEDISLPFQKILQVSARISSGDLRERIRIPMGDEIGDLAGNFQRMTRGLKGIVSEIDASSRDVQQGLWGIIRTGGQISQVLDRQVLELQLMLASARTTVETLQGLEKMVSQFSILAQESSSSIFEMDASNREVFHNLKEMSGVVENVWSSLKEIGQLIIQSKNAVGRMSETFGAVLSSTRGFSGNSGQILEKARESARLAREVSERGQKAKSEVWTALRGAEKIRDSAAHEIETYRNLSASIEKIAGVVKLINGVAERTNLLGLNASIIAVGSVEYGRSFTVVAEEIKELADRVTNSTQEVSGLIKSLQQISGSSQHAFLQAREKIETELDLLQSAEQLLNEIGRQAGRITAVALEIEEIIGTQAGGEGQVDLNPLQSRLAGIEAALDKVGVEEILGHAQKMGEVVSEIKQIAEGQAESSRMITVGVEEINQMIKYFQNITKDEIKKAGMVASLVEEIQGLTGQSLAETNRVINSGKILDELIKELRVEAGKFQLDQN
ncbi:MAG: methyl-accepting chemotaxis protein [bacterium]|nr:methyl-accepting chemotaxis protein [bacterium]